jgi:exodeoxyribonuclease V alpha subunit
LDVENKSWRIALAAPTGKAAARLQEAVKKIKEKLNCAAFIKETIPNEAKTIHRLLGTISNSPYFQFNEKNHLPYDLVVIDEASMVDLPLIAALPKEARLILLGDKDQLASVDAGVVLGDICNQSKPNIFSPEFAKQISNLSGEEIESDNIPTGIQDSIIHLRENYRFPDQSGIGLLSQLVKNGEAQEALRLLRSEKYNDIHWTELNENKRSLKTFSDAVINGYSEYLKLAKSGGNHEKIFNLYENFRILCALRVGIWGTERISDYIEKILNDAGLIDTGDIFCVGQPIMVLQNDYNLRLFNGDVGIILKDGDKNNELRAVFRDEQGKMRKFLPVNLPRYETVWAMTVHKSQGSEFEKVLLALSDHDINVITRELIYTGITRARKEMDIWASEDLLAGATLRGISRQSGLADALRNQKYKHI